MANTAEIQCLIVNKTAKNIYVTPSGGSAQVVLPFQTCAFNNLDLTVASTDPGTTSLLAPSGNGEL